MSETQPTQDTNSNTSPDSQIRKRGRPAKSSSEPVEVQDDTPTIDLSAPSRSVDTSSVDAEAFLQLSRRVIELETAIVYAQQAKIEWLEVDPELLKHLCGGKLPDVGYMIYRNVKLCLKGTAEDLAKRDGLSCHQVLFPKDSYMKVGVRSGK